MAHHLEHSSDLSGQREVAAAVEVAIRSLVVGQSATQFAEHLGASRSGIVTAEPGAGKTTGVPLAVLAQAWLWNSDNPGIVLVEPRRVAARQAAQRMASQLGQQVSTSRNGIVGLRMRGETRIGDQTRIEVVTDGVLAAMLSSDPGLTGRSVIIFDEFHERSLDADLGLALALSARLVLRPDLAIVIMSATLDDTHVASLLGDQVTHLATPGKAFPVSRSFSVVGQDLVGRVEHAVLEAVQQRAGDVLVFLPGIHEINQCARRLAQHRSLATSRVLRLHSRGDADEIAAALRPAQPGQHRIVLATSLAQTSVTIDGITTVIDSGFIRRSTRDEHTGLTRLTTERVSVATATQRAGRAGRTAPGHAVALWSPAEQALFQETDSPEIVGADLCGALLTALSWGVHPRDLAWVDPPVPQAWDSAALDLLALGAVDSGLSLTHLGQRMAQLAMHPRLAALLCTADSPETKSVAGAVAAYFSDSDWFGRDAPIDLRVRLSVLLGAGEFGGPVLASSHARSFGESFARVMSSIGTKPTSGNGEQFNQSTAALNIELVGPLMLRAFPERLASRVAHLVDRSTQSEGDRFTFATGLTLPLAAGDATTVRGAPLVVAVEVDGDRRRGAIRCAVPVTQAEVERWVSTSSFFALEHRQETSWHDDRLTATRKTFVSSALGEVLIGFGSVPLTTADICEAVSLRVLNDGIAVDDAAGELLARLKIAAQADPNHFAVPDQRFIVEALTYWLSTTVTDNTQAFRWTDIDVHEALRQYLDYQQTSYLLTQLAPRTVTVDGNRMHTVHYATDSERPTIRVRLQDLFGVTVTPAVCDGQIPISLELLSPAQRVVAVTNDIQRFWQVGYPGVRADLRGRYPKHHWPEDPATASPQRVKHPKARS
jgi:ATP-dependent helicase HrpB